MRVAGALAIAAVLAICLGAPISAALSWMPAGTAATDGQVGSPVADQAGEQFRLEFGGAVNVRFRARCRIVDKPKDKLLTFVDSVPASHEVSGEAIECFIRKLRGDGAMTVLLRRSDGIVLAYSPLARRDISLRVRSAGPWGGPGARTLPVAGSTP